MIQSIPLSRPYSFVIIGIDMNVMPDEHKDHGQIVAAGPVIKADMVSAPCRVVIWQRKNGEFVVHHQYFPDFIDRRNLSKNHFGDGEYPGTNFINAMKSFNDRVNRQLNMFPELTTV